MASELRAAIDSTRNDREVSTAHSTVDESSESTNCGLASVSHELLTPRLAPAMLRPSRPPPYSGIYKDSESAADEELSQVGAVDLGI